VLRGTGTELIDIRDVLTESELITIRSMWPQPFEIVETKGKRGRKVCRGIRLLPVSKEDKADWEEWALSCLLPQMWPRISYRRFFAVFDRS
jgi:hypothetical protein